MQLDLFALLAEGLRIGGAFFIEDDIKRSKILLERVTAYRTELEGESKKKPKIGGEIDDLKEALHIIRKTKETTMCSSCKVELAGMEDDILKRLSKIAFMDTGREVLREKYPGRTWDSLDTEEKEDVKHSRDETLG